MSIVTGNGVSVWSNKRYEFEADKAERYVRENPAPRTKTPKKEQSKFWSGGSGMNRREFGKSLVVASAALMIPAVAIPKSSPDLTQFGQHLADLDDNSAIITTAQRAFGTLSYGNQRPLLVMSPPRMFARMWRCMMPQQRIPVSSHFYMCRGFMFNGASWIANSAFEDQVVLINPNYQRDHPFHGRMNGWYRAPKAVMSDPSNDEIFDAVDRELNAWRYV